jgi:hypothetical protein
MSTFRFFGVLLILAWRAQGTDIHHSPFAHPRQVPNGAAARSLAEVPQVYTTSHFANLDIIYHPWRHELPPVFPA